MRKKRLTSSQINLMKDLRRKNEPVASIAAQVKCSLGSVIRYTSNVRRKSEVPTGIKANDDQKALFELILRSRLEDSRKVKLLQGLL